MPIRIGVGVRVTDLPAGTWAPFSIPVLITAPLLVTAGLVGTLLTYVPGIYAGIVTTITVQWMKNGVAISGATSPLGYIPVLGDVGAQITVQETVMNGSSPLLVTSSNGVSVTL